MPRNSASAKTLARSAKSQKAKKPPSPAKAQVFVPIRTDVAEEARLKQVEGDLKADVYAAKLLDRMRGHASNLWLSCVASSYQSYVEVLSFAFCVDYVSIGMIM